MKQGEFLARTYWIGLRLLVEYLLSGCYMAAVRLNGQAQRSAEWIVVLGASPSQKACKTA